VNSDRTPPYSLEAEVAVLGALLIAKDAMPRTMEHVREVDFFRDAHRRIYRACVGLYERADSIDVVTLADALKATGEMDDIGGYDYIANLLDAVPTAANVEYHARLVREKSAMRRIIEAAERVIADAYESGDLGAVSATIDKLSASMDGLVGGDFVWVKESLWATFEWIEQLQQQGGGVTGVPSGFMDLDRMTCGFQGGDLVVIAARPSTGKTSFALDVARNATVGHGVPTGIVSMEMTRKVLNLRMLCQEGRVDMQRVRSGAQLSQEEHQRLAAAAGHLNTVPLYVDDQSDRTLAGIRAKAMRLHQTKGLGMLVIDYLQLMRGGGQESRRLQIDDITGGLKELAVKLDVPVILLSQLSRAPEGRTNHRPVLSDLKESSGIEQDADLVGFLYRAEMYVQDGDGPKAQADAQHAREQLSGQAELIVAKQRNGPTGTVQLFWNATYTRFDSAEASWKMPRPTA